MGSGGGGGGGVSSQTERETEALRWHHTADKCSETWNKLLKAPQKPEEGGAYNRKVQRAEAPSTVQDSSENPRGEAAA